MEIPHPAQILMEVYITTQREMCRKPVGREGCSQGQRLGKWHVGTWDNSELDPSSTMGHVPIELYFKSHRGKSTEPFQSRNQPAKMTATEGSICIKN